MRKVYEVREVNGKDKDPGWLKAIIVTIALLWVAIEVAKSLNFWLRSSS
ncbi:MAG TPA: hypothetical protein VJT72_12185 [Pseudonocardiaceae bacterium]|nr:hypothetical protein [Pseudonocardiaceae bacterium]